MEDLISKFFDAQIRIHSKSKTKVTIENRVLDASQFYDLAIKEIIFFKEYVLSNDIWQWNDKDKAQWVLKFWDGYFTEMRRRLATASDAFDGSAINTSDFELVANFHTGEKTVYNSKIRAISKMHPDTFLAAMGKSQRAIITETGVRVATFSFNPYNDFERRVIQLEGQAVVEFNCFQAPLWRCTDGSRLVNLELEKQYENVEPPQEFLEFMEHLFPIEDQRMFAYHWMYHAIFGRNETYLCMNGKKGAGKNYLIQLLSYLVGRDYFKDVNQRFFEEGFNAVLDKARLIQLDEIKITKDEHVSRLKKYINRDQNIEYKGIDANVLSETFNSFIVNNNDITDLWLKWDDRRFSVPDISAVKLEDVWPKEKIDKLYESATDIEFQRRVGFFIARQGPKYGGHAFSVLRGERYWKIVYNSLAEWERVILDMALSREHEAASITDIRLAYRDRVDGGKMFPIRLQKIKDFVDDYRHEGLHQIGEVRGYGENAEIVFKAPFRKPSTKSELDEEFDFKKVDAIEGSPRLFHTVL